MMRFKSVQKFAGHRGASGHEQATGGGPRGPRKFRILLTRRRAAITIVLASLASAAMATGFIFYFSWRQGAQGDGRAETMSAVFGAVMAIVCIRSLLGVLRRPKRLDI